MLLGFVTSYYAAPPCLQFIPSAPALVQLYRSVFEFYYLSQSHQNKTEEFEALKPSFMEDFTYI